MTIDHRAPQQLTRRHDVNRPTPTCSAGSELQLLPSAVRATETLLPTLERLCSMKQRVMLTRHQTETWLAVLSQFPVTAVNRAVLKLGLSSDPFPDLGKIVIECQRVTSTENYAPGRNSEVVSNSTLISVAKALRLKV
ncbi:MAG: hypothetical protein ABGZ53_22325 [Fuerstiella sp.]